MEDKSDQKNDIEISILKGDKLFNQNTPFIINLFKPEPKEQEEKRVNADLICIIDVSGSMEGEKIEQVRESLKILIDMMEQKDRIALVLFSESAELLYDLNYLDEKNKSKVKDLIEKIEAGGGTNIASGLEIAVEILKKEKKKENTDEDGRSSSIILLSDGCDNYLDDIQIGEKLKSLTKGEGLYFTLNTFGYGYDHDTKIMNRLANLRDGSFYLVEDYNKVGQYFVSVLGGCISMISKNVQLELKILNEKCKNLPEYRKFNLDGLYGSFIIFCLLGMYSGQIVFWHLIDNNYKNNKKRKKIKRTNLDQNNSSVNEDIIGDTAEEEENGTDNNDNDDDNENNRKIDELINNWNENRVLLFSSCGRVIKIIFVIILCCTSLLLLILFPHNSNMVVVFICKFGIPFFSLTFLLYGFGFYHIISVWE